MVGYAVAFPHHELSIAMRLFAVPCLLLVLSFSSVAAEPPRVWFDTDLGPILIRLDPERAPQTVEHFIGHVEDGFYDGLVFHRVVPGFVIQAGGRDENFARRDAQRPPVQGEPGNGLLNRPGKIALALSGGNPNSGRTEFFINLANSPHLDDTFTVFGEVEFGQETVRRIGSLRSSSKLVGAQVFEQAPVSPPRIRRAVVSDGFPLMPLHTGSWFNQATAGSGFNLEITNDASTESGPLAVVYWYDFNQGEPIWMTGIAAFEYGVSELTMDLLHYAGNVADFRLPPPVAEFEVWGTLTIRFHGCTSGEFSWDSPEFGSGQADVVRLTLPEGVNCADQ